MKKHRLAALAVWAVLAAIIPSSQAQLGMTGVGGGGFGGVGAYAGPGDVVSGAFAWWGMRCYSNAYSGKVADITDAATGNTTGTRLQCSLGIVSALVSGSACTFVTGNACSSLATTCATACNVVTLYDQSGNTNCTVACDMAQATNATRPTVTVSCLNGHPCMVFNGSQSLASQAIASSQAQPYTISGVAERTGGTGSYGTIVGIGAAGSIQLVFNNAANQLILYSGTLTSPVTANDNTYHAVQGIFNGASSIIYIDGAQTTGLSAGTNVTGLNAISLGSNNLLTGQIAEAGIWVTGFSTPQQSSMNSNQHAYWGF